MKNSAESGLASCDERSLSKKVNFRKKKGRSTIIDQNREFKFNKDLNKQLISRNSHANIEIH